MTPQTAQAATAGSVLDALAPHLSPALFAPEARARLAGVLAGVPAGFTEGLGFECHRGAGRVDVFTSLGAGHSGHARAAAVDIAPPDADAQARAAWKRVRRLHAECARPGSDWNRSLQNVIWEMDVPVDGAVPAGPPVPSVFVSLKRRLSDDPPLWTPLLRGGAATDEGLDRLSRLHEMLTGERPVPALLAELGRFVESLPPEAGVFHLGFMNGRRGAPLRVCFSADGAIDWAEALCDAGWPGSRAALEDTLAQEPARLGRVRPLLQLSPGIETGVGLEVLPGDAPFERFLDASRRVGWLAPRHADALAAWPGQQAREVPGYFFPVVLERWFSHLKVVPDSGGRGPRTKAYLAATIHTDTGGGATSSQAS